MNAFEAKQFNLLQEVIGNMKYMSGLPTSVTDNINSTSFDFASSQRSEHPPVSGSVPLARSSADNISTRFVAEDHAGADWNFNAGGPSMQTSIPVGRRGHPGGRSGRRSPTKQSYRPAGEPSQNGAKESVPPGTSAFDADQWSQKIGSEHFAPNVAASPVRPIRPVKKTRTIHATAGTAGLVEEETPSSGEDHSRSGATSAGPTTGLDSPNAMDIDPPIVEVNEVRPMNGARNIPVEPSRPDWRAGEGIDAQSEPSSAFVGQPPKFPADSSKGSEDQEDLRASFADFNNVAPFAETPTGLGSFSDMKSNLPFDSKPSARAPVRRPRKTGTPVMPKAPTAPRPPLALTVRGAKAWESWPAYVEIFGQYLNDWADYNNKFVDHFAARRSEVEKQRRAGFSWLSVRDDTGIRQYMNWQEEDQVIRSAWDTASKDHDQSIRDFNALREKMKVNMAA
jgi:hypothetical protein